MNPVTEMITRYFISTSSYAITELPGGLQRRGSYEANHVAAHVAPIIPDHA
jgi:hypothetical protein